MRNFITIMLLICACTLNAQNSSQDKISMVLESIENNNTTLQAFAKEVQAIRVDGTTGIYSNPEVEFSHLWGNDNEITFAVTQGFDFPTVYRQKNRIADGKTKQADALYLQKRQEVLQEARELCIMLIYQYKIDSEYFKRMEEASALFEAYEKLFKSGEVNILEYNKAKLNHLNIRKGYKASAVQMEFLTSELTRLNGGNPVEFKLDNYSLHILSSNFEEWFSRAEDNNASLRILEQEIGISKNEAKLARAESLPKFSLGYASEYVPGANLKGLTVGVSVPLWEHKNTVKYRKALTSSLEEQHKDYKLQFLHKLKSYHNNAVNLLGIMNGYKETLETMTDQELLKKALDRGELSLIDYLSELVDYHDAMDNYLQLERDYQLTIANLKIYE